MQSVQGLCWVRPVPPWLARHKKQRCVDGMHSRQALCTLGIHKDCSFRSKKRKSSQHISIENGPCGAIQN